jgi:multicomponent Na+:H+ antiporter subunit D
MKHYLLNHFSLKPFSYIFALAFVISFICACLFTIGHNHQQKKSEIIAGLWLVVCSLLVICANDFLSLYIFYELMAIGSALLIFNSLDKDAKSAGYRYLIIHFFAGILLLIGIVLIASPNHNCLPLILLGI